MRFPKVLIEEATALKEHATKDELDKLDFSNLNPDHVGLCVYGQMTGHCNNIRSQELMRKCAKRVYSKALGDDSLTSAKLNGSPIDLPRYKFWSPIEVFIFKHPGKSGAGRLIKFLKGEIESLS